MKRHVRGILASCLAVSAAIVVAVCGSTRSNPAAPSSRNDNNAGAFAVAVVSPTAPAVAAWSYGWLIAPSPGACVTQRFVILQLTQNGTALTGTLQERYGESTPPGCATFGSSYTLAVTGIAGEGTLTFSFTDEKTVSSHSRERIRRRG